MNNREVIDQVERGYRMAQPTTITYPESKTMPSEVKIAQANVYKVCYIFLCLKFSFGNRIYVELKKMNYFDFLQIMLECWNRDPLKRPTFEFLTHMFEDFNITTQNQYME